MDTKTHIIIPIFSLTEDGIKFIEALSNYQSKQISLDEKDIEKKANFHQYSTPSNFEDYTYENGVKFGYRQALIDILK